MAIPNAYKSASDDSVSMADTYGEPVGRVAEHLGRGHARGIGSSAARHTASAKTADEGGVNALGIQSGAFSAFLNALEAADQGDTVMVSQKEVLSKATVMPALNEDEIIENSIMRPIHLGRKQVYLWIGIFVSLFITLIHVTETIDKWKAGVYQTTLFTFTKSFPLSFSFGRQGHASGPAPTAVPKGAPLSGQPSTKLDALTPNLTSLDGNDNKSTQKPEAPVRFDPLSISSVKQLEILTKVADEQAALAKEKEEFKKKKLIIETMQQELNKKIDDLKVLRDDIKTLLDKANQKQAVNQAKFIKVIEGMKPKSAAPMFDKMDLEVLKDIVPQIAPKKLSGILDLMAVGKAKDVVVMAITEQVPYSKKAKK